MKETWWPRFQLYTHIGYLFIVYVPFVYIFVSNGWLYVDIYIENGILEETCRVIEISLENVESKIYENVVTTFSPPIRVRTIEVSGGELYL